MAKYLIERIEFAGTTVIGGLGQARLSEGIEAAMASRPSLEKDRRIRTKVRPDISFETLDIGTLFTILTNGSPQVLHRKLTSSDTIICYLQRVEEAGAFGGASKNISLTVNKGMVVPLRASGVQGLSTASCGVYCAYDGSNLPIVKAETVSLPTGQNKAAAVWRGDAVINGTTTIQAISQWSIDFGIEVTRQPSPSLYDPTLAITGFSPRASFSTADLPGALAIASVSGAAVNAAGLKLLLSQYASDGITIAPTGAIGFKFAGVTDAGAGFIVPRTINGDTPSQISFDVIGAGSGTTHPPLSYLTSQSVPAIATDKSTFRPGYLAKDPGGTPTLLDVTSMSFDFGLSAQAYRPATKLWPTSILITSRMPRLMFGADDESTYISGLSSGWTTGLTAWWMAIDVDTEPFGIDETEHVGVSLPAPQFEPMNVGGSFDSLVTNEIVAHGLQQSDGSASVSIATGAAISA